MIPSTKKTKRGFFAMCCAVALLIGLLSGCGAEPLSVGEEGADDTKTSAGSAAETARTVVVQETNGTTVVLDAKKASTNAYKGMHLVAGNDVTVQKISDLTMLFDMDKYMYAEESTHFWLSEASGSQEKSKTVIYLDEGATLNRIVNPLENGAVYQVDTPNSTMAVRGTVFRVEVREGKDGKIYTYLAVLNGAVKVELKTTEGKYNGVSETIPAGTAAAIRADETFSEFIGAAAVSTLRRSITQPFRQALCARSSPISMTMKRSTQTETSWRLCSNRSFLRRMAMRSISTVGRL